MVRSALAVKRQLALSLDTTGSMYRILGEARRAEAEIVRAAFDRDPEMEVAFLPHGDYEDPIHDPSSYDVKVFQFTNDPDEAVRSIMEVPPTNGFDEDECYEYVEHQALTQLAWKDGEKRLAMFGDAGPHGRHHPLNKLKLDWREQFHLLAKAGIRVDMVQCLNRERYTHFYAEGARITGGVHLRLDQFNLTGILMRAIFADMQGPEALGRYEEEVRLSMRHMPWEVQDFFRSLRRESPVTRSAESRSSGLAELRPVDAGRFQRYDSGPTKISTRNWALRENLHKELFDGNTWKGAGRVFMLVDEAMRGKARVRPSHRMVIQDRTGDYFTGNAVRHMLKLPDRGAPGIIPIQPWPLGPEINVLKPSNAPGNRDMNPHTQLWVDLKPELGWED